MAYKLNVFCPTKAEVSQANPQSKELYHLSENLGNQILYSDTIAFGIKSIHSYLVQFIASWHPVD
jgi:hypothetical protein